MNPAYFRVALARSLLMIFGVLACAFAVAVLIAPGRDAAPGIEEAHDAFIARYAGVTVQEVRVIREEASARSFEIEFRDQATGKTGRLAVHYSRADGKWEMRPELPAQLPERAQGEVNR